MAGTLGQRKGVWEPLPLIIYGYAVHPLSPVNRRDTKLSSRTHISIWMDASGDEHLVLKDVGSPEVRDTVYAFEEYVPWDEVIVGVRYRR